MLCLSLAVVLLALGAARAHGQESMDGAQLFRAHCGACHAARPGEVSAIPGPSLAGIDGRAAGRRPGYPYSLALAGASLVWNEAKLDAWLTDPQALLEGTTMRTHIAAAAIRRRIIDWLREPH